MNRAMLVTALATVLVLVACTPGSESTTIPPAEISEVEGSVETTTTAPPVRTEVGVRGDVIDLAVLVPRTGSLAAFGQSVLVGHDAYWGYVNEVLGGVGGEFEVNVVAFDHRYDTNTAIAGFERLRGDVIGFAGGLGSPIDEALAPLLFREGMLMVAGSLSSEWVGHDAMVPNLLLPTSRDQVAAGLGWAAGSGRATETAILYQEGAYGEDCVEGYDRAVAEYAVTNVGRVGHAQAATDFGEAVVQLQVSAADTVIVCTTPDALVRVIATAESLDFRPTWLVSAQSFDTGVPGALGGDAGLEAGLAALGQTWVMGASPPDDSPARSLLEDVFAAGQDTNWYTLFGYAQAATFHLVLEEAWEASDLTRAGLRAAVQRLDGVDLGVDGALSSLTGPAPVAAAAVGVIDEDSMRSPFGVPATEPYVASPFAAP